MKMNDMVLVSVDDHICEPGDLFDNQLSGKDLATAPKLMTDRNGKNFWSYQGHIRPSVGLNAVVGRPFEEYGMEPTSLDQLRAGCYDVHARIDDMNINGIAASMCFGNSIGFDGQTFHKAPDKVLALRHMRAYNDWHMDEWCAAYPGRFIPLGILPTWDMKATVAEIERLAAKGFHTVSVTENPDDTGPAQHSQRILEAILQGHCRYRHDHCPAYRQRQPGAPCFHGNAGRGMDRDDADVGRGRRR